MKINRRMVAGAGLALAASPAFAADDEKDAVTKRVEAFRAAQQAMDAATLTSLCAPELSYSHSDAHVEDRSTFVTNATSPSVKVLLVEYHDVAVRVVADAALVRFHWVGKSEAVADGKISDSNLHVLMVWQKQGADWKLLARCSTKL